MQATLVSWLVAAMLSWTPNQGKSEERTALLQSIAEDIVSVVYDDAPIFRGRYAHAHTALLVASVGALESRFEPRIQQGHCRKGECDGGHAYCYMQIHPEAGMTGAELIASQRTCFQVGLLMIRRALRLSGGKNLRAYTGETGEDAPSSSARMKLARDFLAAHPPPVADADFE
jgi:hypothetical protein